jgi:ABC-type uncharacterized transport system YnjBCD ATPase subunit
MPITGRYSLLTLLFLLLSAAPAPAQTVITSGQRLDPASARGERIGMLVQLLLTGDSEVAGEHLSAHAAGPLLDRATREEQLATVLDAIGTEGVFLLDDMVAGGERLAIVRLRNTAGGEPLALLIEAEPSEPFGVTGVRLVGLQMRRAAPGESLPEIPERPVRPRS